MIRYTKKEEAYQAAIEDPYCHAVSGFVVVQHDKNPFAFSYVARGGGVPRGAEVLRKYSLIEGNVREVMFEDEEAAMRAFEAGVELTDDERKALNRPAL